MISFTPDISASLLQAAKELHAVTDRDSAFGFSNYTHGTLEGELAFSLAVAQCEGLGIDDLLLVCKHYLLQRLGLSGDGLTMEQDRLRGWIIGLMDSLNLSLTEVNE